MYVCMCMYVCMYVMTYIYIYIYYILTIVAVAVGSIARSFFCSLLRGRETVVWWILRESDEFSCKKASKFFEETALCFYVLCMCHGQNMVFGFGEKSHPVIHPMGILWNSYRYINPDECILV